VCGCRTLFIKAPIAPIEIMVGGRQVHTLAGHSKPVFSVAFSRDGKRVVSGSTDNLVKIWDTATGALVSSVVGVRQVWSGGEVIVRAFPAGFGLREGGPGEWRGGLSRLPGRPDIILLHQEGLK